MLVSFGADGEGEATLEKRICKPTDRSTLLALFFSPRPKTLKLPSLSYRVLLFSMFVSVLEKGPIFSTSAMNCRT